MTTSETKPRLAIIGLGHVGEAQRRLFGPAYDIVGYDPRLHDHYPTRDLERCEAAVVAVDTPSREDGSCDISKVVEAVDRLPLDRVLIRSTVTPGTTDRLAAATGKEICFSPEYISETDHSLPYWGAEASAVPFIVLGGPSDTREWFVDLLRPAIDPGVTVWECSATEAELIKYVDNAFLALKVGFVNQMYDLALATGSDWEVVRDGWLLDPRVGRTHTIVYPADRGFGGRCLPKDIDALCAHARELDVDLSVIEALAAANRTLRERG